VAAASRTDIDTQLKVTASREKASWMRRSATITVDPIRGVIKELRVATRSAAPLLVLASPEFFVSDTNVYPFQKLCPIIRRFHLSSSVVRL
jgi:hypothetical protein